jgi:hypothetical protein
MGFLGCHVFESAPEKLVILVSSETGCTAPTRHAPRRKQLMRNNRQRNRGPDIQLYTDEHLGIAVYLPEKLVLQDTRLVGFNEFAERC